MNTSKPISAGSMRQGFALVVTLSLMILLTVIAVGLLSLSAVSLRSSTQGEATAIARANARLALMMAIGELQKELGPDSRISAPHDAGKPATGGQPHWTAVYDAWKRSPGTAENPAARVPKFRGWLASGVNQANGGPAGTGDKAILVGNLSLPTGAPATDQISVPMHALANSNGQQRGRIAWWTTDESAKAKINAGPDASAPTFGVSDPLFNSQSPPSVNHRAFAKLAKLDWGDAKKAITISTAQVNLAAGIAQSASGVGRLNHDLTTSSAGVLADVSTGRLKRDLSNLLARDANDLENKPLYLADGRMNRFAINEDGVLSNGSGVTGTWNSAENSADEWGINLEELHLFHNLHRELTWSGGSPKLVGKKTREAMVRDRFHLYRRPVVHGLQFIVSLMAESAGGSNYRLRMMIGGIAIIQNPNDVPMVYDPNSAFQIVQLSNIPYDIDLKIIKDGNTETTPVVTPPAALNFFKGHIEGGYSGEPFKGYTLEPGEAGVFGSSTSSGFNLNLKRGFDPRNAVKLTNWNLGPANLKATDKVDFELKRVLSRDSTQGDSYTLYCNMTMGPRITGNNAKGWFMEAAGLSGSGASSDLMDQLLPLSIKASEVREVSDFIDGPQPILLLSFIKNVERSSGEFPPDGFASRPFLLREPALADNNSQEANQLETGRHISQFLITAEPMNYQFKTLAAGAGGRNIYHGGGRQPNLGGSFNAISRRVPVVPPLSLGAFGNAIATGICGHFDDGGGSAIDPDPISDGPALSGYKFAYPGIAKAIGGSHSLPFLALDQVYRPKTGSAKTKRTFTDHSWMVNTALWDAWFLSGVVDTSGVSSPWLEDKRSPLVQFKELAEGKGLLRNKRFQFHPHRAPSEAIKELFDAGSGGLKPAALNKLSNYLLVDGAFNVNSTSADAWAAFLSSVRDQELLTAGGANQKFEHPFGTMGYAVDTATSGTQGDWNGLRDLSSDEIDKLAGEIVKQVRARGPFLNLADFVNRRPNSSTPAHQALGALQAAINLADLNERFTGGARDVAAGDFSSLPGADGIGKEPKPARAVGSAGYLDQGALLTAIGSQITVRGDTFIIRTYGDSRDASGKVLAKARCEAVVQRTPEYVDPADAPEAQDGWPQSSDKLAPSNIVFGRRMMIHSFRWLNSDEV